MDTQETDKKAGVFWVGFHDDVKRKKYPAWRYHKIFEPIVVNDTGEDEEGQKKGYEAISGPYTAYTGLINWFWDIEDFSPKQLVVYAKEEYGINLPIEAGQERLQRALFELSKWAPQNRDRLVLMAHTIRMNYDETQKEIRRMADKGMSEIETRVVEL